MKKEIKCKRCSLDEDFAICKETVDSMVSNDLYSVKKEEIVNEEFCVIKDVESIKEKNRYLLILFTNIIFIHIFIYFINDLCTTL